jgi:TonB family protein
LVTPESAVKPVVALVPVEARSVSQPTGNLVLIVLGIGIAARALWLTIGAFGLRRLRRDASPLDPLPESVRRAQERIGTRAGIYVSDRVSGPITFGLFRPVVVFPPAVSAMPAHVQEAIAYHELLHVRRRDWLSEILEEVVRSVLWFHPAIWWLIGRIQLTREQVVDQSAIQLTDSRERYVEALLAVALANPRVAFMPASTFLRRHLLKRRVARILQETTMTTRRLIVSLTASAAALALAATFAVRSFPLEAQGRASANTGEPIQLVKGGEHLLHGEQPHYPKRAIEQKVEGDVVVEMSLDERGEVSDARVLSGPEELRKATLEAVLQWHYSPSAMGSTVAHATLRFQIPPGGFEKLELSDQLKTAWALKIADDESRPLVEIRKALEDSGTTDTERAELEAKYIDVKAMIDKIHAADQKPFDVEIETKRFLLTHIERPFEPTFEGSPRLVDVRTEGVPSPTAKAVLAQAGVAVGDSITEETAKRIQLVASEMDEHFHVEFQKGDSGLIVRIFAR